VSNSLKPTPAVLRKLGGIILRSAEIASPTGPALDKLALNALIADRDVQDWLTGMSDLALLPARR
jgi:hypothetical protein